MPTVLSDAAAKVDRLGRSEYVRALAAVVEKCETPFVIGVYGDWGTGKTTILQLIKSRLQTSGLKCVWFNAWLHQADENPALAMLHAIANELKISQAAKKTLSVLGETLASPLLELTTSIKTEDIRKVGERYEAEQFAVRDARTRLRSQFEKFVKSVTQAGQTKLVLFIDDLDRCRPDVALSVLEAIQLYLSLDQCVFIVAADRDALERIVAARYGEPFVGNARFLDKIIQLPFAIPPLHEDTLSEFIREHIDQHLVSCVDLIMAGIGTNPRAVKRFLNVLALNDELAKVAGVKHYQVEWLCAILLIHYLDPDKFALLTVDSNVIEQFIGGEEQSKVSAMLALTPDPPSNLSEYIHLSSISGIEELSDETKSFLKPMTPSPQLAAIIGADAQPRTTVTSRIWAYIKKHRLQDPNDKRTIWADDLLRPIFEADKLSMFEMTKKLAKHLS